MFKQLKFFKGFRMQEFYLEYNEKYVYIVEATFKAA